MCIDIVEISFGIANQQFFLRQTVVVGYYHFTLLFDILGPAVQSVVSLTSSLRVISLTVLADSIYNILIFFAEKM